MSNTPNKNTDIFATFSGEPAPKSVEKPATARPPVPAPGVPPDSSGDLFATFTEEPPPEDEESLGLQRGYHLGGNLELIEAIGRGGMGEVWLANEKDKAQKFLRQVVAKIVPKDVQNASEEMERVQDSFHVVQSLQHAHICPLYRMDKDEQVGYFLVMKHIVGQNLASFARDYKRRNKKQPPIDVLLPMLKETADALDYAHGKGIIHRDVKPQNILYSAEDGAQLIDFGLAATIRTSMVNVSRVAIPVSGTITYMPPEQLRGKYQDERSDQYAFAATAYELLTGRPPFLSDNYDVLRDCILNESVDPVPDAPAHVNKALARALAKNRDDRFENCTKFVEALQGQGTLSTDVSNVANRLVGESKGFALALRERARRFVETNFTATIVLLLVLIGAFVFLTWPLVAGRAKTSSPDPTRATVENRQPTALPKRTPEEISQQTDAYAAMLAPGKKYVGDWFSENASGRLGLCFEFYNDDSGQLKGFFFDPDEADITYPFTGKWDKTVEKDRHKTPVSLSMPSLGTKIDDTPKQKYLKLLLSGSGQVLQEKDMLILYKHYGYANQMECWLKPLSEEVYQKMRRSKVTDYTRFIQAGKCYVAEWKAWGAPFQDGTGKRGGLGLSITSFDEASRTFSGFLFDPENTRIQKTFHGTLDFSNIVTPCMIHVTKGGGWAKQGTPEPSTKFLFLQSDASYSWALNISDNKPVYAGEIPDIPPPYGKAKVTLLFKEIDPPLFPDPGISSVSKKPGQSDRIKEFIQPEKCYVADWTLWGSFGYLGMLIETFDENKQTFSGVFFNPENIGLEKKFEGTFDSTKPAAPFRIVAKSDPNWVRPNDNERVTTEVVFLSKNAHFTWTLEISGDVLSCSTRAPYAPRSYSRTETVNLEFVERACDPQMRKRFDKSAKEERFRVDRIKEFVRPGKQYVTSWSLNGVSGRLGLHVAEFDERNLSFSGALFDVDATDNKKHYSGTVTLADQVAQPFRIQTAKSDGVPFDNAASWTCKLFLMQGRNIDWNLGIEHGKLTGTGSAYFVPTMRGDVKVAFEETAPPAAYAEKHGKSDGDERNRAEKLKEFIKPGKRYVAKWFFGGRTGRLGLDVTNFDDQGDRFFGRLFDPGHAAYKKDFAGFFDLGNGENKPFRITASKDDGMPYFNHPINNVDRWTSNIFLSKGGRIDWQLGVSDGKLTCTEQVDSPGFTGERVTLLFEEIDASELPKQTNK